MRRHISINDDLRKANVCWIPYQVRDEGWHKEKRVDIHSLLFIFISYFRESGTLRIKSKRESISTSRQYACAT